MKELRNIVHTFDKTDFSKLRAALATVVKARGSSYRSPGARMLITDDGHWVGSISGGCLEGDALRKAREVMSTGKSRLITYDTMNDEENTICIGLGCNGVIDVLIEPVDQGQHAGPINLLRELIQFEDIGAIATVYKSTSSEVAVGERWVIGPDQSTDHQMQDNALTSSVLKDLESAKVNRQAETKEYITEEGEISIFFEIVQPSIQLLIFGAGFDVKPVVELASTLGWHITVTDECIAHVAPIHFPKADSVIHSEREQMSQKLPCSSYTAALLMSHGYDYDLEGLKYLINTNARYIGILGPKKRSDKMLTELEKDGKPLSDENLSRIHAPIGLDIGAETPEEIAMAVIAEIQAKFTNRSGGFLKHRTGPIHERKNASDQVFKALYAQS
ncbi:MAG: XdhC/CoxI family protein [Bacteroidota bacterium]